MGATASAATVGAVAAVLPNFKPVVLAALDASVNTAPASLKVLSLANVSASWVFKPAFCPMVAFCAATIWVSALLAPPAGWVKAAALAVPVKVSIKLLVEDTAVVTAEVAMVSLVSSMATLALAAVLAVFMMVFRLSELPNATDPPELAAVLMELTMPCTMKFDKVATEGAVALVSVTAPFMAAAPTDIMLATIKALLLISMACSRVMPVVASAPVAVAVLTVSIWVKSASAAKPKALLTAVKAEALASVTLA